MLTKWIIAIGNTEADGVRMLYAIGSVDQIKRALVELALEDKSNDKESFDYGTEDISDVDCTKTMMKALPNISSQQLIRKL